MWRDNNRTCCCQLVIHSDFGDHPQLGEGPAWHRLAHKQMTYQNRRENFARKNSYATFFKKSETNTMQQLITQINTLRQSKHSGWQVWICFLSVLVIKLCASRSSHLLHLVVAQLRTKNSHCIICAYTKDDCSFKLMIPSIFW